ncbi:acyltransferase family protein, partial [Bradyrhizobium sp.]
LVAILNRTVGALLFLVWLSIIVASIPLNGLVEEWPRPASNFITSHLNLYFFFGMAIAAAHRKKCNSSLLISLVVATAFVSLLRLLWPSDYTMAAVQVLASTLAVSLAVWQHDANVPAPPGSRLLGEISYPIYLIHPTCYLVARGVVKRLGAFLPVPLTIEFLLAIIMSIGAAIFLARLLRRLYRIASIRSISLKLDN